MKLTISLPLLCAFLLTTADCTNGKLNPVVPPIVQAVTTSGCALMPMGLDEQVCDVLSALINGALKLFSVSARTDAGFADAGTMDAGVATHRTEGVTRGDVVIYVGPAAKAAHLRQKLASDPVFADAVDAALLARK